MKALSLYLLTRDIEDEELPVYEQVLSKRDEEIKFRREEIETIKRLVDCISDSISLKELDGFFYSFSIPQIGKEFDLLKIGTNKVVLNIELKSRMIELQKIEKQLERNRYYLNHIARRIYSFAFVQDKERVHLYQYDGRLKECSLKVLVDVLGSIDEFIDDNIESLFKPQDYLVSPLNTPEKFLNNKYYLTSQQEEIKNDILKGLQNGNALWGLTGSAGTGKTLLLYDIARETGKYGKTCIVHCGVLSDGHHKLNRILPRIDIISAKDVNAIVMRKYRYIFIDETQRIYPKTLEIILDVYAKRGTGCVFSYDFMQVLSHKEEERNVPGMLKKRADFTERKLTDKIRTNKEIAFFINKMRNLNVKQEQRMQYKNVDIIYADNYAEAGEIIEYYCEEKNYTFISYTTSRFKSNPIDYLSGYDNTHHVLGQEFDNVIFSMDDNFQYTDEGRLQGKIHPNPDYIFYRLWYQGVSRARERLCILVIKNKKLFSTLLSVKNGDI